MGRWEREDAGREDERPGPIMDPEIQDLLDDGDLQGALSLANQNVLRSPGSASAWVDKGDVLYDMGRYYEATRAYDRSLEINAEQPDLLTRKGIAHETLRDYGSALLCYTRALRMEPDDEVAAAKKAHCLLHVGGGAGGDEPGSDPVAESIDICEALINDDDEDIDVLRVYYEALGMAGRHGDALAVTTRLLEIDADDTDHWALRSEQLCILGRHDAALSAAEGAVKADPSSAQARSARGAALAGLGRHAEALEAFDDAISLDPGRGHAWSGRAASLAASGRHDEAADAMFVAISVDPVSAEALKDPLWKGLRDGIVKRLGGRAALRRRMAAVGGTSSILRYGHGAST